MDNNRFKSANYKRQILNARAYKRKPVVSEESAYRKFMAKIGLASLSRQFFVVAILAAVIYMGYFAKFMMIQAPAISGVSDKSAQDVSRYFQEYKKDFIFIFPQKNILFFSSSRFAKYLLAHDLKIASVDSVTKKPWRHVLVKVTERMPAYNFQVQEQFYILNSDGTLVSANNNQADPNLPLLKDTAGDVVTAGVNIFDSQSYAFMEYIRNNFSKNVNQQIDHVELAGIYSHDLAFVNKSGVKYFFDNTADAKTMLLRLASMLGTLSSADQQRLAYLDLRFDPKVYGCYKTDPCASATNTLVPAAAGAGLLPLGTAVMPSNTGGITGIGTASAVQPASGQSAPAKSAAAPVAPTKPAKLPTKKK